MSLKRLIWIFLLSVALVLIVAPAYSQQAPQSFSGFQVSTSAALDVGMYEGAATISQLKQYGDFGVGSLDKLDGELVAVDGKFYQVKSNSVAYPIADSMKTPFAMVTSFRGERGFRVLGQNSYAQLQQQISTKLTQQNLPHAIRIEGVFPYLKVRSFPKQTPPYPPLNQVVSKQQRVFQLRNVRGTLVGFRLPAYMSGINRAGYHFHFISSDRKAGGHLLDGQFMNTSVMVQTLKDWQVRFPDHPALKKASLESEQTSS